jgi:putative DNA primase/helicase
MRDRIESALSFIPADERETWLAMGMAVKHELGPEGWEIWDQWSQTAHNYSATAARSVWRSLKGSGVTVGTLLHTAKSYGWVDKSVPVMATPQQLEDRRLEIAQRATKEGIAQAKAHADAARKAAWIMNQTVREQHAYLHSKGWKDEQGAVWHPNETDNLLCIPMRVNGALVGVQLIDRNGKKNFLKGQRTSGAEYVISNPGHNGIHWWCEGYATGLALRKCLHALSMRYIVHITFSANNLIRLATEYGEGMVIADNDVSQTGERAAIATGLPYWISEVEGEDFNDFYQRLGLFHASQALRKFLNNR